MTETVLSSPTKEIVIGFDRPFVIIGERINPTGRKKLAEEMASGNFETVIADAIAQVEAGAHMLDVNAGIPLADEPAILRHTVEGRRIYGPGGSRPGPGDVLRLSDLAGSLELLADEGEAAVYGGELGRAIVRHLRRTGGAVTARERVPTRSSSRGRRRRTPRARPRCGRRPTPSRSERASTSASRERRDPPARR